MGVRPHDIELTGAGQGDGAGRIAITEPLGSITVVHLRVDGVTDLVRVAVAPDVRAKIEDAVGFRVRPERIHLFDGATGKRID